MDYYEIGQRVRKYRKVHGFSQEELAEKIGISTTHMSHIETGNTKLSLTVLVSIAQVLEVRTDDLIFDHKITNKSTVIEDILNVLDGCTSQQLVIIFDLIRATKTSLTKHI